MNLKKLLAPKMVLTELAGSTKEEVIENLVDLLMESGKIKDREVALACILAREQKMSTGMQNEIAIPHGKSDTVDELIVCIALKKEGIDFESLDGMPSKIFIMTISPLNRSGPHVQFLAEISQLLKEEEKREQLLAAETAEEILKVFIG
ncbi:MAG: PTS sugar transporter subunit IIA [Spirochaetales bacterium]|nr:PTS sugar transporter subunit IIA [Spirochaetales bacterium]